ncbi:MAG: glycosyltransferase [Nitrospirae bacterium]|nr:glycosyltransferase [Nitrospirota bacterium]
MKEMTLIKEDIFIVTSKKGAQSLKVRGEDGSVKTIHSLYDPEAEAKTIVDEFEFDGRGVLVVLGLGLGYHAAELARRFPEAEILIVEASQEIHEIAKGQGLPIEGNIKFIVGLTPAETIKKITDCQMKDGITPLSVFVLSSVISAFPSYYQRILALLKKTVSIKLWDRLKYPKFKEQSHKVVLMDSGYFLVKEAEKAMISLGNKVKKVLIPTLEKGGKGDTPLNPPLVRGETGGYDNEAIIPKLIEAIIEFKPDFILTMNHLGFDEDGVLNSFLKSIEMPVASWYVDSPKIILEAFNKNVSPYVALFLWDRTYIDDMKSMGFESVSYLPLGTDESVFRPTERNSKFKIQNSKFTNDVGFVGNSLVDKTREKLEKAPAALNPVIEEIAGKLSSTKMYLKDAIDNSEWGGFNDLTLQQKIDFEAAVLWKATLLYRLSCLESLKDFNVLIHGDDGWKKLLNNYNVKPPLNYYKELPAFYNACRINFNATHLQMREAVNQRVFDVPACGAFLLTDYQAALDGLFDVGKEMIVYKHTDEIPELARFYLNNPEKREAVARRARERVLKEHTYKHRLGSLIRFMREKYG